MKVIVCGQNSTGFFLKDLANDFVPSILVDQLLKNVPGVPISVGQAVPALLKLTLRDQQTKQAKAGLINKYTIGGITATAHQFMYPENPGIRQALMNKITASSSTGEDEMPSSPQEVAKEIFNSGDESSNDEPEPLTALSLDDPEQWTMSWTTFPNVYEAGQEKVETWVRTLTDADEATMQFWPTIANNGLAYNLLMLQNVKDSKLLDLEELEDVFEPWNDDWTTLHNEGKLYAIDLRVLEDIKPLSPFEEEEPKAEVERFTPSTVTLLEQHADKTITPLAIAVKKHEDSGFQTYTREKATDGAWLYALQAAKTSVTVYGIWLGHVYHWHIVTAAMQATMYDTLPTEHMIYRLLAPQSNHLIGFDTALLLLWGQLAPPTSVNSSDKFIKLCDSFAQDRNFFDDDPYQTLERHGLDVVNFTESQDWDLYPIVKHYLDIWDATKTYVNTFVENAYRSNNSVANDQPLQDWIALSANKNAGNINGLPEMNSKDALKQVLTSLIYRITMHGASRLASHALPAFTFVANFPPCLEKTIIPDPGSELDTKELLSYLPKTGTIGDMMNFYFVFVFSAPYEPFIPIFGVDRNLFFPEPKRGGHGTLNDALIKYRNDVIKVIEHIGSFENAPLINQWPLNIET